MNKSLSDTTLALLLTLACNISCKQVTDHKNEASSDSEPGATLIESGSIRVRDPFILVDGNTYYLYASKANRASSSRQGVEVYTSKDLQNWAGPSTVFAVPHNFWAQRSVWAPEVHKYKGKYYLFTTFTSDDLLDSPPAQAPTDNWPPYYKRGSQVLVADNPEGPFEPFKNAPHTSIAEMTLDGTLWEEDGQPYMIYCHEWVEIEDGTVELIKLTDDLSDVEGEPTTLFRASDAPWSTTLTGFNDNAFVTDGCYLYKTKTDKLLMMWSSFSNGSYSIGLVESTSGRVKGPWIHQLDRIFEADGGHGMIFETIEGQLVISLHQPNSSPNERMQLYKIKDKGDRLVLGGKLFE